VAWRPCGPDRIQAFVQTMQPIRSGGRVVECT